MARITLWITPIDEARVKERLAVLSAGERARAARLQGARAAASITAWWLLREALGRQEGLGPEIFRFERDAHDRPMLAAPPGAVDQRLGLAHGAGLAAVVLGRGLEVGVDVEAAARFREAEVLAASVLSPEEREELARLAPGRRAERFAELWTLREAYLKARGLGWGLAPPPLRFSEGPTLHADPGFESGASAWRFACLAPRPGAILSVAARGPMELTVKAP